MEPFIYKVFDDGNLKVIDYVNNGTISKGYDATILASKNYDVENPTSKNTAVKKSLGMVKMTIPSKGGNQSTLQSRILGFALKSISCKTESMTTVIEVVTVRKTGNIKMPRRIFSLTGLKVELISMTLKKM